MNTLLDVGTKILLATGIIILFVLQYNAKERLVYVDSKKLVLGYKGVEKAKAAFELKASQLNKNLDTLNREFEQLVRNYQAQKNLSATVKKTIEQQIDFKQQQYLNYEKSVSETLKNEDDALTAEMMGKVNEYLRSYGRKKGYRIILASTLYGNIAYADETTDITDDVLKGLNEAYK